MRPAPFVLAAVLLATSIQVFGASSGGAQAGKDPQNFSPVDRLPLLDEKPEVSEAKPGDVEAFVDGTRLSTAQIDLRTYAIDRVVAPGRRFAIALEVSPHAGIHIYAPGATDYRVLNLAIASQPFMHALPLVYPAPETWAFDPLHAQVPTYQSRFSLVQWLVLDGRGAARAALRGRTSLTISGTLSYQACDEQLCYRPASMPLSWTINLKPA